MTDRLLLLMTYSFMAVSLSAQSVPPEYQDLYTTLNTQISTFDSTVKAGWDGSKYPVLYAAQLQSASSDEYTDLLEPYYYVDNVIPELEEQQALGAQAVTVHIDLPILYKPFYVSNPAQFQQFVSFYQQLATDIHARGMKMIVECTVMSPFPGNLAGSFTSYYQNLSWSDYMTGRAQTALNVAQLIVPDYMTVITEPDTEASVTGQANAGTVTGSTQLLQTVLSTLQAAGATQVVVGAGSGTWINSFTQYIQSFAATSVQFVDMHIYPVNNNDFLNALTAASIIQAAGKEISVSEGWDYKIRNTELGKLTSTQIYARDPFSFWSPIDIQFLDALIDFANAQQVTFISPFWTHYFFAYLDYNTYGSLSDSQVLLDSDQATTSAISGGLFTATGLAWLNGIIPAPDTTPPVVPGAPYSTNIYPTTILLAWAPTMDNTGVAAYNLFRDGSLITTTSLLSYNDQNLSPGATYTYTLSAFDASGNVSGVSSPLIVQTMNTTPPSIPTGLQTTGTTDSSVSLTWNVSTGIGGVGGYRVLRGTSPDAMTIRASPVTNSYTDPYCYPSTTYYYAVESFNPLGATSQPSNTIVAETAAY